MGLGPASLPIKLLMQSICLQRADSCLTYKQYTLQGPLASRVGFLPEPDVLQCQICYGWLCRVWYLEVVLSAIFLWVISASVCHTGLHCLFEQSVPFVVLALMLLSQCPVPCGHLLSLQADQWSDISLWEWLLALLKCSNGQRMLVLLAHSGHKK